ncbi:MAG: hypothetical protein BGP16_05435 [Sphingobium sp. 66-54]|nr:MAG: hypothetical protein BGP16_05435 [Sphingobium sp. 66-54]
MVITPGAYIARRREHAGFTVEDVALRIETTPQLALRERVDWLRRIENDVETVSLSTASAMQRVFPLSVDVALQLVDLHSGEALGIEAPRLCRVCACSDLDACVDEHGEGCAWAGADLCTACVPGVADEAVAGASSDPAVAHGKAA